MWRTDARTHGRNVNIVLLRLSLARVWAWVEQLLENNIDLITEKADIKAAIQKVDELEKKITELRYYNKEHQKENKET